MLQFEDRNNIAALRRYHFLLTGAGNGVVPALTIGHGVTLAWTATGRIKITFAENPGTFVGIGAWAFRDPTQANVKNWNVTAGAWPLTANTFTIEIDLWNGSGTAVDLATTSFLDLELKFSELKNP